MVVWFAPAVYYVGVVVVAAIVGTGVMIQADDNSTIQDDGPMPVIPIYEPRPVEPVIVDDPTEHGNDNPQEYPNDDPNENPNENEHTVENPTENPTEEDYDYNNETGEPEPFEPTDPDIYIMPTSSFGIYAEPPVNDDRAAIAFILSFIGILTSGMFFRRVWKAVG